MPVFPSVEWFDAIKNIVNNDPAFRQLGTFDATMGVKVEHKIYELKFEAFECTGVREGGENDLRDMDFWLELPYDQWKDMLTNIRQHGRLAGHLDAAVTTSPQRSATDKIADTERSDRMAYNHTLFDIDPPSHVATITLNKPERMNAIDQGDAADILDICKRIQDDDDIWIAIWT